MEYNELCNIATEKSFIICRAFTQRQERKKRNEKRNGINNPRQRKGVFK